MTLDLQPAHIRLIRDILSRHLPPGVVVWVFGSRARGKAKPYADLDLALEAEGKRLSFETLAALADELDASDLPFKVDLVDRATLEEGFWRRIEKECVRFPFT